MNKQYIYILFFSLSILGLSSCSDYLSEIPDNRTTINSTDKIAELLVGAYPDGSYMQIAEVRSDNVDDKGNLSQTGNLNLNLYSWEIPIDDQQDSPIHYWAACYKAIAQANQALQSIEELNTTDEEDLSQIDALRGEGLLARAYAHFMLVNLWSEHYDPATASTDLGIPYVTEPETELLPDYERNSVQEVYNLIEKDLIEGLSLVENNYDEPKYHFTPEAARAFAVRFYLFRGNQNLDNGGESDWDKVLEYSNQLLTSPAQQIRDWTEYSTLQYSEIENLYSSSTEQTNLLIAYTSSTYTRTFASSRFGLSNDKLDELFAQGAGNPTGNTWAYPIYGTDLVYNIPKFQEYFEFTNVNAGIGYVHVPNVLFSYDEVLLARAEAYAMKSEYANSLNDINAFLSQKTDGYNALTDAITDADVLSNYPYIENEFTPHYELTPKQTSYIKGIAELRRREYYFEGLRWFDIKRFHLQIEHEFVNRNDIVLEKNDNRRLLQIPQNAIATGIEPNPR